ncbi:NHL repeat-containing protein [Brucepastera parasyntrophica]|uniref:NHL repeat-containing protein n=1 Tax=Brucepastera parasyntrophica TaxID=2880008 RepID=UPI00210CE15E|nr:NHL repeat-containing protein [Brucepastera parasyntrophica]ULQ59785.1 NHL repeat-containing protein [Brucepastera parasyntrophica]
MKKNNKLHIIAAFLFGIIALAPLAAQVSAADRIRAEEEFRRGVQAYYRGAFNDSILQFEKAFAYLPGEPLILDWLGKAYYRSGIEGTALQQWQYALDAGYENLLLRNRMEIVHERRSIRPDFHELSRFVEASQITAKNGEAELFLQPVSVVSLENGTFWVSAYGSNELIHFDVNGQILHRARGPLTGFDRPFDLVRLPDGKMLVSEMSADRISVLDSQGRYITSFGSKGRQNGEFIGPQYIAFDSSGNIFVTDYGNARIVVFDPEYKPLFTFGKKSGSFPGFTAPAGIAVKDDFVYVADSVTGALFMFDTAGNFIRTLVPAGTLRGSESVRLWNEALLVSMQNRVCMIDSQTGALTELARLGNAPIRITGTSGDANGNLILADYKGNTIQVISRMSELVGGLFVQIERVNADAFPQVTMEVRVEDRNRNPVVGLNASNFLVTEEQRPVSAMKLVSAAYNDDICDITILIDRSLQASSYINEIRTAIAEIAAAMNGRGNLRIVSAGALPVQEGSGPSSTGTWRIFTPKAAASASWAFDMGLRLAVNDLINASEKRAVIFLSAGTVSENSFSRYGLNELAAYMTNNGVLFSTVYLNSGAAVPEYDFLSKTTGGKSYYVYRSEGLEPVVRDILNAPNGSYIFSYTSLLPTDFGRAYLPLEVEAYLMNRSGRDETGYFAPLE